MIACPISLIQNTPITQYSVFDCDPHGQFICIYLSHSNCIHIIQTFQFPQTLNQSQFHFITNKKHPDQIHLKSACQIPAKDLYESSQVQKIVISSLYNHSQIILVSNYFNIKVFSIIFYQEGSNMPHIVLKHEGQIFFNHSQPIHYFKYHQEQIWVTLLNGQMDIYEKVKSVWVKKQQPNKMKRQQIRLTSYKKLYQPIYQLHTNDESNKIRNQLKFLNLLKKKSSRPRPRTKHLLTRYLSEHYQRLHQMKLLRRNYHCTQPTINPDIVYISKDNILCRAHYSLDGYELQELCNNNQRPRIFKDQMEEYIYQKMYSQVPLPYLLCPSQNYIIGIEQQGFTIMVKSLSWRKVFYDIMYPTINPFIYEILISALDLLHSNMSSENAKKTAGFLTNNFHFILAIFSKEDDFQNKTNSQEKQKGQEKSKVYLQLIACRKVMNWENINKQGKWNQINKKQKEREREKERQKPQQTYRKNYKSNSKKTQISQNPLKSQNPFYSQHAQNQPSDQNFKFEVQRFRLLEIKISHEQPEAIRWITPNSFIFFARKQPNQDHSMFYAMFKQDLLVKSIFKVFKYLVVQNPKQTKGVKFFKQQIDIKKLR